MPAKIYRVDLSDDERSELKGMLKKGTYSVRKIKRAQVLLKADEGRKDREIIDSLGVSRSMVERTRRRLVEGGLEKALNEDPRPGGKRKIDGRVEAHLIAITSSEPPDDHDHWTVRLLADQLVEKGLVESISYETVRQALKKMN
jgi:transposase